MAAGLRRCALTCVVTAVALATLSAPALAHVEVVVEAGDTVSGLAARHGVSRAALVEVNGITNPDVIVEGTTLVIPTGASASSGGAGATHEVAAGETLSAVAARYGVTVSALAAANGLPDPNRIVSGRTLVVPAGGAAVASAPAPSGGGSPTRGDVGAIIDEVAASYGWNPALVRGLAMMESGWNNSVVSSAGARGIMQVLPETGVFVGQYLVGRDLDLGDARDNVVAGVAFLDYLWGLTDGDVQMTLAGYYQGLASVRRNGLYEETRRYIADVLALKERYS